MGPAFIGLHSEKTGNYAPLSPKAMKVREKEIAEVLKPKLEAMARKLQQFNSDVINFGEELRIQNPGLWSAVDWKKLYPTGLGTFIFEQKIRG